MQGWRVKLIVGTFEACFNVLAICHTGQDASPPGEKHEIVSIKIDPSCFDIFPPLFIHLKYYTYLEVSIPIKTKMAHTESSMETPVGKQEANLEGVASNNHTSDGTQSKSAILEEPRATPTIPITPFAAPNGGLKAWSAVLGGFLCQFASFGFLNVYVLYLKTCYPVLTNRESDLFLSGD
jgi:hypothetical protein